VLLLCAVIVSCNKRHSSDEAAPRGEASGTPPAKTAATTLVGIGDQAPEINATAHTGQLVKLSDFRGKPVVVYFYPKDDSPGCTIEAQELRDLWLDLQKTQAVVVGVSSDDNVSHQAFATKYELPFLLLPDTQQKIARAFGVPVNNGRAKRVTFIIDSEGKVRNVFVEVSPKGHGAQILEAVKAISS
jgi:peroxiredoxin Q/BCP